MIADKQVECMTIDDKEVTEERVCSEQVQRIIHKLLLLDKEKRDVIISDFLERRQ